MAYLSKHVTTWTGDSTAGSVTYHQTTIVRWDSDTVTLNTDGHDTATTRKKMNQAAEQFLLGFSVYQKNRQWFVTTHDDGQETFYEDGMTLHR